MIIEYAQFSNDPECPRCGRRCYGSRWVGGVLVEVKCYVHDWQRAGVRPVSVADSGVGGVQSK